MRLRPMDSQRDAIGVQKGVGLRQNFREHQDQHRHDGGGEGDVVDEGALDGGDAAGADEIRGVGEAAEIEGLDEARLACRG